MKKSVFSQSKHKPAILALADGRIFPGISIGADANSMTCTIGEVVFNTAMTGYQEILTDPSYAEQIITLTYPHIGSVGVNGVDNEAKQVFAKGLIIRDLREMSNWRGEENLSDFLKQNNIVGIAEIDTRALTRHLREHGAQNGCIMVGDQNSDQNNDLDASAAVEKAKAAASLEGMDLAKVVSTKEIYSWTEGTYDLAEQKFQYGTRKLKIVAYDFGIKLQILRLLADRGCDITVVPAETSAEKVLELKPDGIFLSNGPGDPAACDYAIKNIQAFLDNDIPLFGICLGFQLLALALGAKTQKMKQGHHGANHPVQDLKTGRVMITSQNHGFMVDGDSLPDNVEVTHRSLFDDSLQGFKHKSKKAFGFQGHPEASPGPQDIVSLFDDFVGVMGGSKL